MRKLIAAVFAVALATLGQAAAHPLYAAGTDDASALVAGWNAPVSLGVTLGTGTAQPISWGRGNEEVFWRGADDNLYQEYSINGTWYGPDQLTTSANLASDPEPVSWGVGNLEVFWRGTDGNLWQMYYLNGWQGPASLGDGPLGTATPMPVSWGPGNIEVFWEGTDQNLWEAYYANGWHGPVGLGDGPLGADATIAPVSWGPGNLDIFWKGTDQNLWEAYFASGWHGPVGLGDGPLGSAPHPVASQSGVLDVFWEGTDGNLWDASYGGGWSGPQSLGSGPLASQPEVTSWGGGRVDVFWIGTDGGLWHDWYQGGWNGPQGLGGMPLDSLPEPVTTGQPGYIDVVWTGPDSALWHAEGTGAGVPFDTGNPAANDTAIVDQMNSTCGWRSSSVSTASCEAASVTALDAAMSGEGLIPTTLPADFWTLPYDQQLILLANGDREARNLPALVGPESTLDGYATIGADDQADPVDPAGAYWWTANWTEGPNSVAAELSWMYDDGLGSGNVDCTASTPSGCWIHREDILHPWTNTAYFGGACASPSSSPWLACAEIFVQQDA